MVYRCLLVLLMLHSTAILSAQQTVTGKVYSGVSDSVIRSATVYSKRLKDPVHSDQYGRYSIAASEGDTLIFSAIGFARDTVIVQFYMFLTQYDVTLAEKIVTLQGVEVTGNYQDDSLNRRNYYRDIFKKQPGVTGFNRPADGVGIVFSPITYFSKGARQKRGLKKRLLKEEKENYVDLSFPVEWVEKLTGLKNDSLTLFMYRYRPSYEFCRKTDRTGMLIYINDKLREFTKPVKN